jgi:hypothetical protein
LPVPSAPSWPVIASPAPGCLVTGPYSSMSGAVTAPGDAATGLYSSSAARGERGSVGRGRDRAGSRWRWGA